MLAGFVIEAGLVGLAIGVGVGGWRTFACRGVLGVFAAGDSAGRGLLGRLVKSLALESPSFRPLRSVVVAVPDGVDFGNDGASGSLRSVETGEGAGGAGRRGTAGMF
jgi:hypothetical protein